MQRQVLGSFKEFVPLSAFERIDREKRDSLEPLDVVNFMKDNEEVCSEEDAYLLIRHYDQNNDGKLNFAE